MRKIYSLILLCTIVLFASCKEEEPVQVTAVSLDKTTLSLVVGTKGTLTATITPDDAETKDVSWMSCNPAIATVDDKGEVTAVAVGKATVTVITADGGKMANCEVIVTAAPVAVTGITLDKTALSLGAEDKEQLTATIAPEDATNTNVTWTTSDDKIATVSATGEVTAIGEGVATITATTEDGGKTATCIVTVADRPGFMFYGKKNKKSVYFDGVELKFGEDDAVVAAVLAGNDYYGITNGGKLYKNGVIITDENIVPSSNVNSIRDFFMAGESFYVRGAQDGKECYWKDGQKQEITKGSTTESVWGICVLGSDVFIATSDYKVKHIYVYKNGVKIADIDNIADMTVKGMVACDGKAYLGMYGGSKCSLYMYDGTTFVESETVDGSNIRYFASSGKTLFSSIKSGNQANIYKNVDWSTALPSLVLPEGYETPSVKTIIEEGSSTYVYASCEMIGEDYKDRVYCWRNFADPVRLPADTVYFVVHLPK